MLETLARLNLAINEHGTFPTSAKTTFQARTLHGFQTANSGNAMIWPKCVRSAR